MLNLRVPRTTFGATIILFVVGLGLTTAFAQSVTNPDTLYSFEEVKTADTSSADTVQKRFTVSGRANVGSGELHERFLQIFIQNEEEGLSLFADSISIPVQVGDSVVATGLAQEYYGLHELRVEEYEVFPSDTPMPEEIPLEAAFTDLEQYEGMLVSGRGLITEKGEQYNGKYVKIAPDDTSGHSIMVYVSNFHSRYDEFEFDNLSIGDGVEVKGVLSMYTLDEQGRGIYKVMLRTPGDFSYIGIPRWYLFIGLSVIVLLAIMAAVWLVVLKIQVRKQTLRIEESLKEKEVLLQEIHHRVKNNLAMVSGLLELQLDNTDDPESRRVLRESQNRIRSIAIVHNKLYQSHEFAGMEIGSYIRELVQAIVETYQSEDKPIRVIYELDKVSFGIDQSTACGLLLNELVINAIKHAFGKAENREIRVELRNNDGQIYLAVEDNGTGLPEDFNPEDDGSLGMLLIRTFANQLEADMRVHTEPGGGTRFEFEFKREEVP